MLTKFDKQLESLLKRHDNAVQDANDLLARYHSTRQALISDVYPNIVAVEPHMTDHGYGHIKQVQDNALRLVSDDGIIKRTKESIQPIEMYCLGMMILFHDAGMIDGRQDHHTRVGKMFNRFVHDAGSRRKEMRLVALAARAHTGTATDGTMDTLKHLDVIEDLDGESIRLRELAAILRLSDELAESPSRTSQYMQENNFYRNSSTVHHEYSTAASISIDRAGRRIVVQYDVEVHTSSNGTSREASLQAILDHMFSRILKTDKERRYTRQYSELLRPFESTEVSFHFHCKGELLEFKDLRRVRLSAFVVPEGPQSSDTAEAFWSEHQAYDPKRLIPQLLSKCKEDSP